MLETILRTKLYIPPLRPNLVPRPQLIDRLNQGFQLGHKLTLISAPAGFGKTTLVSKWVGSLKQDVAKDRQFVNRIAWLSLDEGDNDLTRFLAYVVAALGQVEGIERSIGKGALSMLQSPQPPPSEPVLTSLINDISAIPHRIILVLDDYHLIDSPAVDGALTFLLEHLPPQLHLAIATRDDPNLPSARLRARGQLTELRAIDLRFSISEAAEFLNQVMGLDLSAEDVSSLESRTEGWIAGLQLAAISMQGREGAASLIKSFTGSHRFVLDYLMEEVLEQQPADVYNFLLQTAILDRFNGSLCDALTDQENGQATLETLEHANLFVVSLDAERRWYRYHHLFSELLRQRLRQNQPERLTVLHIKAGEWFNQQGLSREAIRHLLAAKDYQGATELIRAIAIDVMQQGEHTTVVSWIDTLPDELMKEQPYLCVLHAWALHLAGKMEPAYERLVEAEKALDNLGDQDETEVDTILGLIHSQRAYKTFMTGELDKTIHHAQQALDHLPENVALFRTRTCTYQATAHLYQGQLHAAMEVYNEILPTTQRIGGTSTGVMCFSGWGDLHVDMAQLHRAKDIYQQALDFSERYNGRPDVPFTGYIYVRIGHILRQWTQLEDAHRYTSKGLALCRDWNVLDVVALSCIELAYIQLALGNEEKSQDAINEAIHIMESFSPFGTKHAVAHQVYLNLARGDFDAAARWALTNELVLEGDFEYHREIEYLALARVFIAQKRFEEAQALVERIYRIAQEIGKRHTELEGLILLALVFSGQGETEQALVRLEKALVIGEPESFIRIFVDEGPPMAQLLYKALSRGIAPDYVRRLLAAFPVEERGQIDPPKSQAPESELIEPLSERELEVLQLIAEGLSNPEIASRLYLSLNTVKVHSRNIYGKLGVHNRMQAVARARALGILPSI
jgi:LuxR family maltose regulon positive regulatory protein